MEKADFDIMPPPGVNGVGRYLEQDSLTRFLAGVSYGPSRRFSGNIKGDTIDFPMEYALNSFGIFGDVRMVYNESHNSAGLGFGLYPYPYLYGFVSMDYEKIEIGVYALTSVSVERVDYAGMAVDAPRTYRDYMMGDYDPEYTQVTDEYNVHGNGGAGLFINVFVGDFTASYVPSVYLPWLYFDGFDNKKGYESSVWFPLLVMQEFRIDYNYSQWSLGAGITSIVSNELSNSYWKIGISISYYSVK